MSVDIGLDPLTGDLPEIPRYIRGDDLTAQRAGVRLRSFRGEWFLDADVGLPYLEWVGVKPVPLGAIRADLQRTLETTPGVVRVENLVVTFDRASARVTATGAVVTADDTLTVEATLFEASSGRRNRNPAILLRDGFGHIAG